MGVLRRHIGKWYRKTVSLLLLGLVGLLIFSACSHETNQSVGDSEKILENCRIVEHTAGESCIPHQPKRVVTLWMGTFSSALALGIQPIATAWYPGGVLPTHLGNQTYDVENMGFEPNLERILSLQPDLILSNTRLEDIYTQLSTIAPTVVLDHPAPPAPWQKTLQDLAKVLDKEQKSQQLIGRYWERIEQLKKALGDRRLEIEVSVANIDKTYGIYTYGTKHPTGAVLDDLELQRPPAQRGEFFTRDRISWEHLSDIDGDVLFLSYRGGEEAKEALEKLQQSPLWQKLRVVQKNRVYLVNSDHWYAFDILAINAVIDDLFKYLVNTP
jgi:iron complex transport system substrate-binding protein